MALGNLGLHVSWRRRLVVAVVVLASLVFAASVTGGHASVGPDPAAAVQPSVRVDDGESPGVLSGLARTLESLLSPAESGGVFIRNGRVHVAVTDPRHGRRVIRAGGVPIDVDFSVVELNRVHQLLGRYVGSHDAGGVQSWYVDVPTNRVVVTVEQGADDPATRAFLGRVARFGERVEVVRTTATASAAAFYGGLSLIGPQRCSAGFNARNSSGYIVITAGHCVRGSRWWYSYGRYLGYGQRYSFPGNDHGSIAMVNPGSWQPRAQVYTYNGRARLVYGYSRAAVGSWVCKSGATTGWTCGRIRGHNETVVFDGRHLVYGLTRISTCIEPGDSGGAVMAGNYAQGTIAAGQFYYSGGRSVCGQRVGRANVAWHQPIGEALRAYDARLLKVR